MRIFPAVHGTSEGVRTQRTAVATAYTRECGNPARKLEVVVFPWVDIPQVESYLDPIVKKLPSQ